MMTISKGFKALLFVLMATYGANSMSTSWIGSLERFLPDSSSTTTKKVAFYGGITVAFVVGLSLGVWGIKSFLYSRRKRRAHQYMEAYVNQVIDSDSSDSICLDSSDLDDEEQEGECVTEKTEESTAYKSKKNCRRLNKPITEEKEQIDTFCNDSDDNLSDDEAGLWDKHSRRDRWNWRQKGKKRERFSRNRQRRGQGRRKRAVRSVKKYRYKEYYS